MYTLRLTAWDLAGRTNEISARIVIAGAQKTIASQHTTDAVFDLGGHDFALTRSLGNGDFGNWQIPALNFRLSHDQPLSNEQGGISPWQRGARVWLQVPVSLGQSGVALQNLSFTLDIQAQSLGNAPGAPLVYRPVFSGNQGWTLTAHGSEGQQENLQRLGQSLYRQTSGLPWVPAGFTLTDANGNQYQLDAQGRLTAVTFSDGVQWLVSDAGIAVVGSLGNQRLDFQRDDQGRIQRIMAHVGEDTNPNAVGQTWVYRYDSRDRLILARDLNAADTGTPYGYGNNGQLLTDTLTANLGAAANWLSSPSANQWQGTLNTGQTTSLAFSVRDNELAGSIKTPGASGAVIVAIELTSDDLAVQLDVIGGSILSRHTQGNVTTLLLRVSEAGLKLIRLQGSGNAQVKVSLAGDLNHDGAVDGLDSQAFADNGADLNGDGVKDSADRQVLYANYGWRANQAPVAVASLPSINTHADLGKNLVLTGIAQDPEGDQLFWRVLGAAHGTAKLSADGLTLLFTPDPGYTGPASVTLQADDGFAAGKPIELAVNVSAAKLLAIHVNELSHLATGQTVKVKATVDFADEKEVVIDDAAYLTLRQVPLDTLGYVGNGAALKIDDGRDLLRAQAAGAGLVLVQRVDSDGRLIQAALSVNVQAMPSDGQSQDAAGTPLVIAPDVYPGTLTLLPGTTRQLKVHMVNLNTGGIQDIAGATQTEFAGTPEETITEVDPYSGEFLIDPVTGEILTDPVTGEYLINPSTVQTITYTIPAQPAVYSGTRYLVSDESVAGISADGLITAHQAGQVQIFVVHLASVVDSNGQVREQILGQTVIALKVQAPQVVNRGVGIAVNARDGGAVQAATGETVLIGAGALHQDTQVAIERINLADLQSVTGMAPPAPGVLQAVGSFKLQVGTSLENLPLQLAIPLQDGNVQAGDEVVFFKKGQVPQADGGFKDTWWLVDNGYIGSDGTARTASPPYSGVRESGEYLVTRRIPGVIGSAGFSGTAGSWLDFTGTGVSLSLTGAAIGSDIVGILATAATSVTAGRYHFGIPQFVEVDMTAIPANQRGNIDVGHYLPPVQSPVGQIALPNISHAEVTDQGEFKISVDNSSPGQYAGHLELHMVFDNGSSRKVGGNISGDFNGTLTVNPADHQHTAIGKVRWQIVRVVDNPQLNGSGSVTQGETLIFGGNLARVTPKPNMAAVLTRTGIDIVREVDQAVVHSINLLEELGKNNLGGDYLTGSKVQPVVFSTDLSTIYVAGKGKIYEIDTLTYQPIGEIDLHSNSNIASLTTAGDLLIIGEAGGTGSRLLVTNIDPGSPDFHQLVSIKNTGIEQAPRGVSGLVVGPDGKTLIVGAPQQSAGVSLGDPSKRGDLLILDLATLDLKTGKIAAPIQAILPADGISGKAPQVVSATQDPDRYLVSNIADYDRGLSTLTLKRDAQGLVTQASLNAINLSQPANAIKIDRLDIQRAQSAVLVTVDGVEYAIVSDDNYHFLDPYWKAMYEVPAFIQTSPFGPPTAVGGSASAKKVNVGGKLGIVQDPFGTPKYLGATLPLDGYGIVNLSASPDGKVLLGQLKGGYSGDLSSEHWLTPYSQQTHDWDVKALIKAALAMPARDRLSKHIVVRDDNEQLVNQDQGYPAGSFFDAPALSLDLEGRMGDVIEVDLKRLIARKFLGLSAPEPGSEPNMFERKLMDLIEVNLLPGTLDKFTGADDKDSRAMTLVSQRAPNAEALDTRNQDALIYSRNDQGAVAKFSETGRLYFTPNLTKDNLADLRSGKTLAPKTPQLNFSYQIAGKIGELLGDFLRTSPSNTLTITLKDYEKGTAAQFVGDRKLDNPGYSDFTKLPKTLQLIGGIRADSRENDRLSVAWIEQRLKYLGYAKLDANGKPVNEIQVDGQFNADEQEALKLFEAIVRQGSAVGLGVDSSGLVQIQYKATVQENGTLTFTEVSGSLVVRNTSLSIETLQAAKTQAIEQAKQNALAQLGNLSATGNNGVDGRIEANGGDATLQAQRNTTLNWLNAYNSPHWIQFFLDANAGGDQETNVFLPGWINRQSLVDVNGDVHMMTRTSDHVFGTSWLFDLMLATSLNNANAAEGAKRTNPLWFAGTNTLGTQLNLGINTAYIGANNQNQVNGKDKVLGVIPDKNNEAVLNTLKDKLNIDAYQNQQWNYQNALYLAGLLNNPNVANTTGSTTNGTTAADENQQNQALLDFMSLYAATQKGNNGGWDNLTITNGTAEQQAQIKAALFGDGTQTNGLIDENNLLIGGTSASLGDQLTAESLARIMDISNPASVAIWVEPLKQAMKAANINTPQRIAAFLAQVKQESGSLTKTPDKLLEGYSYPNSKPSTAFPDGRTTAEKIKAKFSKAFPILASAEAFVAQYLPNFVAQHDENGKVVQSPPFTEQEGILLLNYAYSGSNSTGVTLGNHALPSDNSWQTTPQDGWLFRGHGLLQLTGRSNFQQFANYIDTLHLPNLPTGAQIMADPDLVASNLSLDVLSSAWYWSKHNALGPQTVNPTTGSQYYPSFGRLNDYALQMPWTRSMPTDVTNVDFDKISRGIGLDVASYSTRWKNYKYIATKALVSGNPYENINKVLNKLGLQTGQANGYQNQVGISLAQRTLVPISKVQHLQSVSLPTQHNGNARLQKIQPFTDRNLSAALETQVQQARVDLDLTPENTMIFIADASTLMDTHLVVIVAEAKPTVANKTYKAGLCVEADNFGTEDNPHATNIFLGFDADSVLHEFYGIDGVAGKVHTVEVLQAPKTGKLEPSSWNTDKDVTYNYTPNRNVEPGLYDDDFIVNLSVSGYTVTLHYYVKISILGPNEPFEYQCKDRQFWKMSQSSPESGAASSLPLTFEELTGSTLAQTTGTGPNAQITLDTDAAGYGWFVDSTPNQTEEFLPTSNPYKWVAKAGSEAAGKMDMLSVWLHELGHALGLDHSVDGGDFMASTLQPGVRRLPTAEELAWLTGWGLDPTTTPASSASPASLSATPLDPNAPSPAPWPLGTSLAAFVASRGRRGERVAMASAANPTLTNPEFAPETASGSAASQWDTQGTVDFSAGNATLHESASSQTRLSQTFVVAPNDRYLSFTLSGIALDDVINAADDAFEVALIDANSGLSLLGGTGLSHNDAFLNLQADGTEYKASGVTTVKNADGSRTVLVDLAGIAAGTVVNLSFDLIGFGRGAAATSSHVTVKELRLGVPREARDDTATLDEDAALDVDVVANDIGTDQPGVVPALVSGPAHGTVEITAEGRFRYKPAANWSGEDSFSYRLSDGKLDSNVALVKLTVTPVNDAPTIAPQNMTLDEDGQAVIDLLQGASDVDDDVLTATVTTTPQHGSLTQNADGTWAYVPNADWNGSDAIVYQVSDGALSTSGVIALVVKAVNDAPTIAPRSVGLDEDGRITVDLLQGADDIDGDVLSVVITGQPANGNLIQNADGTWTYTPNANWNGTDVVRYQVTDGQTSVATELSFVVAAVNDAPVAEDDEATLAEDGRIQIAVSANDHDIEQDVLSVEWVSGPAHGQLELSAGGSFWYAPVADFYGEDSFTYRVYDGGADYSNTATVRIQVAPVNDAPVVTAIEARLDEDNELVLDLHSAVFDVDGDPLHFTVAQAEHGRLTEDNPGLWRYRPDADYNGPDQFQWTVSDGQVQTSSIARLTISAVNDAPLAQNLTASVDEDGSVLIYPLARAFDIDSDALTLVIDTGPAHGSLTLNADQSLVYRPDADWSGEDNFSYHVNDGELDSAPATVKITVNPVADAPALVLTEVPGATRELFRTGWEMADNNNRNPSRIHADTLEGWTSIAVPAGAETEHCEHVDDREDGHGEGREHPDFLVWSNGDRLGGNHHRRTEVYAAPGNGENWLALNGPQQDQHHAQGIERQLTTVAGATYTLSLDFAAGLGASAGVSIYVDGVRIGSAQAASPDGALAWQSQNWQFTGTGGMQILRVADSPIMIRPVGQQDRERHGGDSKADKDRTDMVMLDNIALTEVLPAGSGWEDQSIALPQPAAVLKDRDGSESLSLRLEALPVGAEVSDGLRRFTATLQSAGVDITGWNWSQLRLTPPKDFFGAIEIGVVATATESGNQDAAETRAVIALQILAVNDAPVAENASYTLNQDGSIRIDFAGLVSDIDGTALTLQLGKPGKGTLTRNADGSYTYKPKHGYTGSDSFSYTVSDGELTAAATISLGIEPSSQGDDCTDLDHDEDDDRDDRRASYASITLWSGLAPNRYGADSFIVLRGDDNTAAAPAPARDPITIDWNGATDLGYSPQDQWLAAYLRESKAAPASLASITGLVFPVGDK